VNEHLNFSSITFIKKFSQTKNHDKEFGVLGMVKIKLPEVKLQDFAKIVQQKRVKQRLVKDMNFLKSLYNSLILDCLY